MTAESVATATTSPPLNDRRDHKNIARDEPEINDRSVDQRMHGDAFEGAPVRFLYDSLREPPVCGPRKFEDVYRVSRSNSFFIGHLVESQLFFAFDSHVNTNNKSKATQALIDYSRTKTTILSRDVTRER
uniref:Uncharacterized protein n=1 Tax=Vespula pensylvanica TaxID=30213 RepID=A0A834PD97_VESPE|nr:hypothetical protein H0235_000039 [Vespula pensylvanica]